MSIPGPLWNSLDPWGLQSLGSNLHFGSLSVYSVSGRVAIIAVSSAPASVNAERRARPGPGMDNVPGADRISRSATFLKTVPRSPPSKRLQEDTCPPVKKVKVKQVWKEKTTSDLATFVYIDNVKKSICQRCQKGTCSSRTCKYAHVCAVKIQGPPCGQKHGWSMETHRLVGHQSPSEEN